MEEDDAFKDKTGRKKSQSGDDDTAFWFGHVQFRPCALCQGRRGSEYTAGNVGVVLKNKVSTRETDLGIAVRVSVMQLKQAFLGMYLENVGLMLSKDIER